LNLRPFAPLPITLINLAAVTLLLIMLKIIQTNVLQNEEMNKKSLTILAADLRLLLVILLDV